MGGYFGFSLLRMARKLTEIYYPSHRNPFSTCESYVWSSGTENPSSLLFTTS